MVGGETHEKAMPAPDGPARKDRPLKQEENMTATYSLNDLTNRSLEQLYGLYCRFEFDLLEAVFGSTHWYKLIDQLAMIAKAICIRRSWPYEYSRKPRGFGPGF